MKKLALILMVTFVLASCGTSKPTKFYTLSAVNNEKVKTLTNKKITVGVDTVSVPGYIERPQIVTIKDSTELDMSEYNRWAEPLSNSIQRVIAENVSQYMKNGMAKPLGAGRRTYDYVVIIELNKLDGKFGDKAELDAWWTISGKDFKVVARERTKLETPMGGDYNDFVEKQNELLAKLSFKIAQKISKLK